jgi:hypothetical protein
LSILSSPDGSCFLSVTHSDGRSILRAYHWSNFGSTDGIEVDLDGLPSGNCAITSFLKASIHFVALVPDEQEIRSLALSISHKITEFSFQEKGLAASARSAATAGATVHNCLIDCHADVWTRFPVVPAVRRRPIKTMATMEPKALYFVTDRDHHLFGSYWENLILQFERQTRKPTEKELSAIVVHAMPLEDASAGGLIAVSTLPAGQWLVDILCLIPIHIAIARDNRFVPLKDGVFSAELERSLLGARVETIIDRMSFGWYESIFRSYMTAMVSSAPFLFCCFSFKS